MQNAMTAMRAEAATRFSALPELALKYGQNIFFDAKKIVLPFHVEHPMTVRPDTSGPDGVRFLTLAEAFEDATIADDLLRVLATHSFADDKGFHWMLANLDDALVVSVPAGMRPEAPIMLTAHRGDEVALQHIIVHAGAGATATILDKRSAGTGFLGTICDIIAGENATVHYAIAQSRDKETVHASYTRALGARLSHIGLHEAHAGGAYVRSRSVGHLAADDTTFTADVGYRGDEVRQFDYHCESRHAAPRTISRLRTALVLDGTSKAIARALTHVTKGAQGSDARQRIDAMLLSERAEADTVPQLEIGTDDVSCSHAATTGRPNAAMRFYLESRGLSPEEACQVIVEGHFGKLFTDLTDESVRTVLQETLVN
jgi:Fe-S cluster assembly protein SufD